MAQLNRTYPLMVQSGYYDGAPTILMLNITMWHIGP